MGKWFSLTWCDSLANFHSLPIGAKKVNTIHEIGRFVATHEEFVHIESIGLLRKISWRIKLLNVSHSHLITRLLAVLDAVEEMLHFVERGSLVPIDEDVVDRVTAVGLEGFEWKRALD